MTSEPLGFPARLWLAFVIPWKILFDSLFAARVRAVTEGQLQLLSPEPAATPEASPAASKLPPVREVEASTAQEADTTSALQLLAIMQREGRFVDFLQEDITSFSDAEIGAAARVVHEGCRRGLHEYLDLSPVRSESEGETIVLEHGFDSSRLRLTGNVVGEPPFRGRLAHHGWLVTKLRLPSLGSGANPKVIAPAEVEL